MNPATRLALGFIALGMLIAGGAVMVWGSDSPTGGVLVRVGAILGAVWLVAPSFRRPGLASLIGLAAGTLVLIRPRLVWVVVVAALVWWAGKRRAIQS